GSTWSPTALLPRPAHPVAQIDARHQAEELLAVDYDRHHAALEDFHQLLDRRVGRDGDEVALHRLGHRLVEVPGVVDHFHKDIFFVDDADDSAVAHHGQLRNVVELHALVGGEHGLVGADGGDRALGVAPRDQVAQIARAR